MHFWYILTLLQTFKALGEIESSPCSKLFLNLSTLWAKTCARLTLCLASFYGFNPCPKSLFQSQIWVFWFSKGTHGQGVALGPQHQEGGF